VISLNEVDCPRNPNLRFIRKSLSRTSQQSVKKNT
jgi:hypothetical protein